MKAKLSAKLIERLEPKADGFYIVEDTEQRGLQLMVTKSGNKTWMVFYRVNGERRRPSVGRFPEMTVDEARRKAREVVGAADQGKDFSTERKTARAAKTLREFCTDVYLVDAATRLRAKTLYEHKHRLDNHIYKPLGDRKLSAITAADVRKLHQSMAAHPIAANRAVQLLRVIFNKAIELGHLPENTRNPARPPQGDSSKGKRGDFLYPEKEREHFLEVEDFGRLAEVLDKAEADQSEPIHAIQAIRLLMLTGCRRDEILGLRWSEVKLNRKMIDLPDIRSKEGKRTVYLSPSAVEILEKLDAIRTKDNPFVIEGHRGGKRLVGIHRIWDRLRKAAKLPDTRIHDLRHSFASTALWSGVSLSTVGKLLGHHSPISTKRYGHISNSVAIQAADLTGQAIVEAMSGKVVEIGDSSPVAASEAVEAGDTSSKGGRG